MGLLIDDAIVVIENIFRRLQNGESPRKAAFSGTKEIGLAVMATTFSIVVVFLPVAFMKGIIGRYFYQFGMTVAFSVVVSLFIAFSLTPMLSSKWLSHGDKNQPPEIFKGKAINPPKNFFSKIFYWLAYIIIKPIVMILNFLFLILWKFYKISLLVTHPWNRFFDRIGVIYKRLLGWSLNHRFLVVSAALASFVVAMFLAGKLGAEFMPETDEGRYIVAVETPQGTDLETTSATFKTVENLLQNEFEGIILILTTIGSGQNPVNEGQLYVKLVDKDDRPLSAKEMIDSTRIVLASVPGIKYAVAKEAQEGGSGTAVELSIRGTDSAVLADLVDQVDAIFRSIPGIVDLDNSMAEGKPELQVNIDRGLANDLGLDIMSIGSTVRSLVEGDVVTRFKEGDKEYDVRVRLKESDRANTAQIERLLIASKKEITGRDEFLVPLGNVASMKKTTAIGEYKRLDRLREVRIGSNVATGAFAGTVLELVMAEVDKIDLPPGYYITRSGMSEIMTETAGYMFEALILAVIFIYLLLASQFESFFDPFSIMFSLPLSLVGAIIALLLTGDSLSIMSMIGIIMLMGLVTKNAILLIDFVNQRRRGGMSRSEAILDAGPIRLRPIMMTTISLIFGVLPLALGLGPGAEMRAPMARAVIGGMTSSTLLTLVVVPIVYTVMDDIIAFFKGGETITVENTQKEVLEHGGSSN
ncbi:MAG: efflux RND transporter permease subunit [candidate division Zixibacteria bacterium]|nr:efflux RND transporter permease subunit [candidate division Zixibacteria bacterium]